MSDDLLSGGTYRVRGPGGLLTADPRALGIAMLPPDENADQQWEVAADSGTYTLRSRSGLYLGSDGNPDEPQMTVRGTSKPYPWRLSTGEDDDETTYVLTPAASSEGLRLSMSMLRVYPPMVAILPLGGYSVEWAFDPC